MKKTYIGIALCAMLLCFTGCNMGNNKDDDNDDYIQPQPTVDDKKDEDLPWIDENGEFINGIFVYETTVGGKTQKTYLKYAFDKDLIEAGPWEQEWSEETLELLKDSFDFDTLYESSKNNQYVKFTMLETRPSKSTPLGIYTPDAPVWMNHGITD